MYPTLYENFGAEIVSFALYNRVANANVKQLEDDW